jgi:hypothetical protein
VFSAYLAINCIPAQLLVVGVISPPERRLYTLQLVTKKVKMMVFSGMSRSIFPIPEINLTGVQISAGFWDVLATGDAEIHVPYQVIPVGFLPNVL